MLEAKQPDRAMMVLVDRLAAAIPPDTFLRELAVTQQKVRLVGASANAPALVGKLEAAGLRNVRFTAAITRGKDGRDNVRDRRRSRKRRAGAMTVAAKPQLWRYGSLALFCGVPLVLLGLAIANLVEAWSAGDESAREQTTLSQIVAQAAPPPRPHAHPRRHGPSLYLASASASLARAEIQEKATALVTQAGGHLAETQIVGTPEDEAAGLVAIQLTLSVDNNGLLDLLYRIETGLPLFQVSGLNVSRSDGQGGDAGSDDRPASEGAASLLHVELTVTGRWRKTTG